MTSLAWGPVGHCTSGRPLNPNLVYLDNTADKIRTLFHASDANGRVRIKGRNNVRDFNFNTI